MQHSIPSSKEVLDQAASWSLAALASPTPPTVPKFLAVIWRNPSSDTIFITRLPGRKLGHFDTRELDNNSSSIPHHHFQPCWNPSITLYNSYAHVFTTGSPGSIFIKKPRLVGYDGTPRIAEKVKEEIIILEYLQRRPHPNLLEYYGCLVDEERRLVTGICMREYATTLGALLEKRMPAKQQPICDYVQLLKGVLAGIKHLHALGIAHNDITPSNIMLDEHGFAVIVDFNNAAPLGQPCRSGTPGWTRFSKVSAAENDMFGYGRVQECIKFKVLQVASA